MMGLPANLVLLKAETKKQAFSCFKSNETETEAKALCSIFCCLFRTPALSLNYLESKLGITDVCNRIDKLRTKYQMNIQQVTKAGGDIVYSLPQGLCCGGRK